MWTLTFAHKNAMISKWEVLSRSRDKPRTMITSVWSVHYHFLRSLIAIMWGLNEVVQPFLKAEVLCEISSANIWLQFFLMGVISCISPSLSAAGSSKIDVFHENLILFVQSFNKNEAWCRENVTSFSEEPMLLLNCQFSNIIIRLC